MAPPTPPIPPVPPTRGCRSRADTQAPADRVARLERAELRSERRTDQVSRQGLAEDRIASSELPAGDLGQLPLPEVPFAWQHEQRLLLLDEVSRGWTFAELRFDQRRCRYVEVRRATFRWPREAAGALLARGVAFGEEQADRLAAALDRWLTTHAGAAAPESQAFD